MALNSLSSPDSTIAPGRPRPSLGRLVTHRIGRGSEWRQTYNLLIRPFGAKSFADFWRLWNPFYGYYLFYFCYKPLRRALPRPAAEIATFAASGFLLHDLPIFAARRSAGVPYLTIWFVLCGTIALAAESLHMNTSRLPFAARAAINLGYLLSTLIAVVIVAAAI